MVFDVNRCLLISIDLLYSPNRFICRGSHGIAKGEARYITAGIAAGQPKIDTPITLSACDLQKPISFYPSGVKNI